MTTRDGIPVRDQDNVSESASGDGGRHTGLRLAVGIISIVLGILIFARPVESLVFVAILFGFQLVILGIVRAVLAIRVSVLPTWLKVLSVVLGVVTIIAGVFCFVRPEASLTLLAIVVAIGWIADGIADLVRGIRRPAGDKAFVIMRGVISIVAGIVVAVYPGSSLVLLAQTAGVALIVIGVVSCLSFIMRRRRTT